MRFVFILLCVLFLGIATEAKTLRSMKSSRVNAEMEAQAEALVEALMEAGLEAELESMLEANIKALWPKWLKWIKDKASNILTEKVIPMIKDAGKTILSSISGGGSDSSDSSD